MNQEKIEELDNILKTLKVGGCSSPQSHSQIFQEAIDLIKPKEILEIGFFCGSSAGLWLNQSNANLTSVDPFLDNPTNDYLNSVGRPEEIGGDSVQLAAVESLKKNYPERFKFIHKRSLNAAIDGDLEKNKYQLAFIDGEHGESGVTIDLNICLSLRIPFLLLDDYNEMYNGVRIALAKMKNRFLPLKQYDQQNDGADAMFVANLDIVKIETNENN